MSLAHESRAGDEYAAVPDFRITEQAQTDLEAIDDYIAADNPKAADRLLDELYAAMQRAADDPERAGLVRHDPARERAEPASANAGSWLLV